ncbi:MAG TPA: hypothetical protein VGX48_16485 [Pyrinomonadaceae bacterium]|nr:hypothetical protein [Pyrinomonadaceae bacterium]
MPADDATNARPAWAWPAYALGLAVYLLRLDSVAGAFVDDAWYVLLAKALASGHGFTVVNSPSPGITPIYPPAFPALLSLVFRAAPAFPENVWLLKSVSVAAVFAAAALARYYLARFHGARPALAHAVALLTLLTPAFVFLATSTVMSECFFTLVQLAAVVCVERSIKSDDGRLALAALLAGAGLSAAAFLTRSIAVGTVGAAVLFLLLNRRVVHAVIFSAVVLLCVGPWLAYSRAHAPTPEQKFEQQGLISQTYAESFWQKAAGDRDSGTVAAGDLPARVADNLKEIFVRDAGGLIVPALYRDAHESGQEVLGMKGSMGVTPAPMVVSTILCAVCLAGLFVTLRAGLRLSELSLLLTLPVILLWPWAPFRFLLPFAPFIFLYLVRGTNYVGALVTRLNAEVVRGGLTAPARILLMCAVLLNCYDHARYLLGKFGVAGERPDWVEGFEESEEVLDWMRANVSADALVATENPALVHLRTGLKTVSSPAAPELKREDLARRGARFLAHVSPHHPAIEQTADPGLKFVKKTTRSRLFVVELGGR